MVALFGGAAICAGDCVGLAAAAGRCLGVLSSASKAVEMALERQQDKDSGKVIGGAAVCVGESIGLAKLLELAPAQQRLSQQFLSYARPVMY